MSAVTVKKEKNIYNVRDAFKFQKTVGSSNEHCCVSLCAASSCCNSETSFPKDTRLRAQWLHKRRKTGCSVTELQLPKTEKVCGRNFEKSQIHISANCWRVLASSLFEWNNSANSKTPAGLDRQSILEAGPVETKEDDDNVQTLNLRFVDNKSIWRCCEWLHLLSWHERETLWPITGENRKYITRLMHGVCLITRISKVNWLLPVVLDYFWCSLISLWVYFITLWVLGYFGCHQCKSLLPWPSFFFQKEKLLPHEWSKH